MTTFLIISNNQSLREDRAIELAAKRDINRFDIFILETQGSIGIEDIRNFQKHIILKPIKGKAKAAIIKNSHNLTIEAQNALLKTLEEPPANTYIFLTAETANTLLPTILSRASIIFINQEKEFDEQELQIITDQLHDAFSESIGMKLKLAETLATDKLKAISWFEKAIHVLRKKLVANPKVEFSNLTRLESLQTTHHILKTTNVNARLALEILFLNF